MATLLILYVRARGNLIGLALLHTVYVGEQTSDNPLEYVARQDS